MYGEPVDQAKRPGGAKTADLGAAASLFELQRKIETAPPDVSAVTVEYAGERIALERHTVQDWPDGKLLRGGFRDRTVEITTSRPHVLLMDQGSVALKNAELSHSSLRKAAVGEGARVILSDVSDAVIGKGACLLDVRMSGPVTIGENARLSSLVVEAKEPIYATGNMDGRLIRLFGKRLNYVRITTQAGADLLAEITAAHGQRPQEEVVALFQERVSLAFPPSNLRL
jgi:hypothetical protein